MKVTVALLFVCVAFVKVSKGSNENEVTTQVDRTSISSSSSEENKERIKFPTIRHKFVVSMKAVKVMSNASDILKQTRKPIMAKIIPNAPSNNDKKYWKQSTRQPLIKYTKFSINPTNMFKNHQNIMNSYKNNSIEKRNKRLFNRIMDVSRKEDSSEEEKSDAKTTIDNATIKSIIPPLKEARFKENKESNETVIIKSNTTIENSHINVTTGKNITESKFSSEEREDNEEFIFIKPKKNKGNILKVQEYSKESDEATTGMTDEVMKRQTRSVNVIEEENLGTTVSGFKFTGKVASLSSDIMFKNINTR